MASIAKHISKTTIWMLPWILWWFLGNLDIVYGSYGDRSYIYQKCLRNCQFENCSKAASISRFKERQPWFEEKLQWTCEDECQHQCMWVTVEAFRKDTIDIPQFHGKWPFLRVLGIQEPASVVFSVLNGLYHLLILTYRRTVPSSTPMYYVWHVVAVIGLHAWTWSTIYHSRDFPLTEKMDYFCAFSLVLANLGSLLCRVLGTENRRRITIILLILLIIYLQHIWYLAFVKFNYGYNMKVNIAYGCVNLLGWLGWCWRNWTELHHTRKCLIVMVGMTILPLLEVLDFPPIWWTFDAHSLWHAGTIPLGILWYSFIIDDGRYLAEKKTQ
ncbi:post-GPI attachment to proteins factor 3-like isoform X2 [Ostrea edulis]|uniref:post-GPI attachment to proteins factor 3-like isoform X2 n=1 Tax=Ostrea edulis TaxID=37623 RepID=UPI0024AEC6E2|nr:post-GPI attachment to proteins factor 3-like isoform X2 [Ostrea edulis]